MINYKKGDIILVPFPFSDQSAIKKRPAVIISSDDYNRKYQDVIILAVTSKISDELYVIDNWKAAGLLFPSAIKPVISTIEHLLIIKKLGVLAEADLRIIEVVKKEIFGE